MLCTLLSTNLFAYLTDTIRNYTHENIKSVTFKKADKLVHAPIILLDREFLQLQFDDLSTDPVDYLYNITLCDYKWEPSNVSKSEYLSNIQDSYITDSEISFNTYVGYTHYKLNIPNEETTIKLSGNYILKIYREDTQEVVLVRRFIVYENKALISSKKVRPDYPNYEVKQKIEFEVICYQLETFDYSHIKTCVYKNYDWKDFRINKKPNIILGNKLVYRSDLNLFDGENEYRFFNISSTRGVSVGIDAVERIDGAYNFFVTLDEPLKNISYYNSEDINGNFKINALEVDDSDTESEYTYVNFELRSNELLDQEVYIYGGFNNWQITPKNKMHYDYDGHTYYASLFLKQGFYNYKYVTKKGSVLNLSGIDGSFFEAKNDYHILVYLNSPHPNNSYRVIGYKLFR